MSVEPTTATRFHEPAERPNEGRAPVTDPGDGPPWHWVEPDAPADRPAQRALHRACRTALRQLRGDPGSPEVAHLTPRIVERTIDRYLAHLLGVAEPRGRRAGARLKVHAMVNRRAPAQMPGVGPRRPAAAPVGPRPANANHGPTRAPAPLLPPEAPLEMPEQDLS